MKKKIIDITSNSFKVGNEISFFNVPIDTLSIPESIVLDIKNNTDLIIEDKLSSNSIYRDYYDALYQEVREIINNIKYLEEQKKLAVKQSQKMAIQSLEKERTNRQVYYCQSLDYVQNVRALYCQKNKVEQKLQFYCFCRFVKTVSSKVVLVPLFTFFKKLYDYCGLLQIISICKLYLNRWKEMLWQQKN